MNPLNKSLNKSKEQTQLCHKIATHKGHSSDESLNALVKQLGEAKISVDSFAHMYTSKGCTPKNSNIARLLGSLYNHGIGTEYDLAKAIKYYKLATDQNDPKAVPKLKKCSDLMQWREERFFYVSCRNHRCDPELAFRHHKRGIELGNIHSHYEVGHCYEKGAGVAASMEKALEHYKIAADLGDDDAQCALGSCYKHGRRVKIDIKKSFQYYKLAADQGDGRALFNVGICYEYGRGVAKDEKMALRCYKLAAEQIYPGALDKLGKYGLRGSLKCRRRRICCHREGYHKDPSAICKDFKRAFDRYKLLATKGDSKAQYSLAHCYDYGRGVQENKKEAFKYYNLSADQGNAKAQCYLGWCYLNGQGVEKDEKRAVKYFKLSADQKNVTAYANLAECYKNGYGVEKNKKKARKYFVLQ